mgnify:CR=1 FL=1|jgi:hypothetical protein|tara:strand:- start:883 stop:1032 length:150 start_codon:yes stop_codon:yes gene_type:complete
MLSYILSSLVALVFVLSLFPLLDLMGALTTMTSAFYILTQKVTAERGKD